VRRETTVACGRRKPSSAARTLPSSSVLGKPRLDLLDSLPSGWSMLILGVVRAKLPYSEATELSLWLIYSAGAEQYHYWHALNGNFTFGSRREIASTLLLAQQCAGCPRAANRARDPYRTKPLINCYPPSRLG